MNRILNYFKSPKQKLEDEIKKLKQQIDNDRYGKQNYFNNQFVRFPKFPDTTLRKTDAELEEAWKKLYLYKDFDDNGNDRSILEKIQELQNQIDTIEQEEEKENQEEQNTNDAWRDARYQGLSRSGGKSGKRKKSGKSGKRKNKKNTKTKKNKSLRHFKKRMQ
jgi:vacuolar-type H+-ATPase subunit I/STV1